MERRALPYGWDDVKSRLQRDLPRVLDHLGIRERVGAGGLITPLNPTRNDRNAGSFVIWTAGDRCGRWRDYATGEGGDVLDLVLYLGRLREPIDAYWWALDHLGLSRGTVRTREQADQERERLERDRKARDAKALDAEIAEGKRLLGRWLRLVPIKGTVAETYLREARKIPLDRLGEIPSALRFAPELDHEDDKTGEVTTWPCMVAAMGRGHKGVTALHRTWLQPDGSGKASVPKAKKMIGSTRGAAIRLTKGDGGLTPAEALKRGHHCPLVIGEGIETTLTVGAAVPDYRCWAAGSLSLMQVLEWPEHASAVILLKDNDWKPEAMKAFERVEAHWRGQARGRPVKVVASEAGSDFNDMARGA